ncbi:MAG: DUF192 domain-containing protein [Actinomycetota bacterium]|nr:DUF192 domain-containing protein [Actinomycetota bacterium]
MSGAELDDRFGELPISKLGAGLWVIEARTHKSRRRGLSHLDVLPADHGLHIPQTPSVHTFGMRFALDLIWLAKDGAVVRVDRGVQPRRIRVCLSARSVVETMAGQSDAFLAAGLGGGGSSDGEPGAD